MMTFQPTLTVAQAYLLRDVVGNQLDQLDATDLWTETIAQRVHQLYELKLLIDEELHKLERGTDTVPI